MAISREDIEKIAKNAAIKVTAWRQKAEERLGAEGLETLKNLNNEWRKLDTYQIKETFPKVRFPGLEGYLDTLNWLGLAITSELPIHVSTEEKMEQLQRHLDELKSSGYFLDYEPSRFKKFKELFGEERAKELFVP